MTFWDRFYKLCISIGIKPNTVAKDLGFSSGVCTQWKKGLQEPSYEKASKIAQYFGVTTDYLLGRDNSLPIMATDAEWDAILNSLSDESLVQLRDYTNYLIWKQDQDAPNSL